MADVHEDCVACNAPLLVVVQWLAGIWIDIEPWEIATRDVESDTVTALEEERSRILALAGMPSTSETGRAFILAVS